MLYRLLKLAVRTGLRFYRSRIRVDVQPHRGPVILACNYPNSFLDALIIGSRYKHPIHFLARGDAFAKPAVARLRRRMNMIPIHRLSEGRAGLKQNEQSFAECLAVLRAGGTFLIFSEGICKNEAGLRPLKKGTARLAHAAWEEEGLTNMIVKPVALSYSGFARLPVSVDVNEGPNIFCGDAPNQQPAQFYQRFDGLLQGGLQSGLRAQEEITNEKKNNRSPRIALAPPAVIGWLMHKPLYAVLKKNHGKENGRDGVLSFGALWDFAACLSGGVGAGNKPGCFANGLPCFLGAAVAASVYGLVLQGILCAITLSAIKTCRAVHAFSRLPSAVSGPHLAQGQ